MASRRRPRRSRRSSEGMSYLLHCLILPVDPGKLTTALEVEPALPGGRDKHGLDVERCQQQQTERTIREEGRRRIGYLATMSGDPNERGDRNGSIRDALVASSREQ